MNMKKDRIAIEARDDAKRSISSLRAPDPRPTHAQKTRSLSLYLHGFRVEKWRQTFDEVGLPAHFSWPNLKVEPFKGGTKQSWSISNGFRLSRYRWDSAINPDDG